MAFNRSDAAVLANTTARTRGPNSLGNISANDRTAMPPMLCPIRTTGASPASASRTAFRSRPRASSE